jgi:peptide subunit release factor 1 (eRF1)
MQVSGTRPAGALRPDDLADLAPLFASHGPFLSLCMATPGAQPQAAQQSSVRWATPRAQLAAAGAPSPILDAIDPVVTEAHHDGAALVVIADTDGIRHVDHAPEPPRREFHAWAPLPRVGTLLEWRQARVPYLLVLIDREGADLIVVDAPEQHVERETSEGREAPLRKVAAGGWSQRRYQQRAENTWRDNARNVGDRVTHLVDEHDLPLVIVAGDVRAVELLETALPERIHDRLHAVDGSRAAGGRIDEHDADVRRLAATEAATRSVALLRKFEEELGQADRAVNGPAETLAALARAQVDVLLVHDDPDDDRVAWFGPKPLDAALSIDDLRTLGIDDLHEGRAVDVAMRAAIGSGAGIRIVPHTHALAGGIGALLRW